jgi:hypothetical protein
MTLRRSIALCGLLSISCGARTEVSLEGAQTYCSNAPLRDRPLEVIDVRATTVLVTLTLEGRAWTQIDGMWLVFRRRDRHARADVSVDRDLRDPFAVHLPVGRYDVELARKGHCSAAQPSVLCVGGVIARDVEVGSIRRTLLLDVRPQTFELRVTVNGQAPTIEDSVVPRTPEEPVVLRCGESLSSVVLDGAGRASIRALPNDSCELQGGRTGECSLDANSFWHCRNRVADRLTIDPTRREITGDIATRPLSVTVSLSQRMRGRCRSTLEIERDGARYRHNHEGIESGVEQAFWLVAGTYDVRARVDCAARDLVGGATMIVPLARALRVDGGREPIRIMRELDAVAVAPSVRFESAEPGSNAPATQHLTFEYEDGSRVQASGSHSLLVLPGRASLTVFASNGPRPIVATFEGVSMFEGAAPALSKRVFSPRIRLCARGVCRAAPWAESSRVVRVRFGSNNGVSTEHLLTDERTATLFATDEPVIEPPRRPPGAFASPLPLGSVRLSEGSVIDLDVERLEVRGRLLHNGERLTNADCGGINFERRSAWNISDVTPQEGAFSFAMFEGSRDELWAQVCPCNAAQLRACGSVLVRGCAR